VTMLSDLHVSNEEIVLMIGVHNVKLSRRLFLLPCDAAQ